MNTWTEPEETLGDTDYAELREECEREARGSLLIWAAVLVGACALSALYPWGFALGATP